MNNLPLSKENFQSFKPLSKRHNFKNNVLEVIEVRLFKSFFRKKELVERDLIITSLITLSIYYMRASAVKKFDLNRSEKILLRERFLKYGQLYYNKSLRHLRHLISKDNFNVELAVVVSELLNKVSIFEFRNLNNSLIFSKGLISIFESVLIKSSESNPFDNKSNSIEMVNIMSFFNFASLSSHFPNYKYNLLYEFREHLTVFEANFRPRFSEKVIFYFNHLKNYTLELISHFENRKIDEIYRDYNLIYKLLRSWLINYPPMIQIIDWAKDPIEFVVLRLFQAMALSLNNLFPSVNGIFLTNFEGHLRLFDWTKVLIAPPEFLKENNIFIDMNNYCDRVIMFFRKRYNMLSAMHNYMTFGDPIYVNNLKFYNLLFNHKQVFELINEIMIERFQTTKIRNYHFVHLPSQVKFTSIAGLSLKNQITLNDLENTQLFSYNKHHMESIKEAYINQFLNGNHPKTPKRNRDLEPDPVFNWMYENFTGDTEASISLNSKANEFSYGYQIFANIIDYEKLITDLEVDYFYLLNKDPLNTTGSVVVNKVGFFKSEKDIRDFLHAPNYNFTEFMKKPMDPVSINEFFKNFNKINDQLINTTYESDDERDIVEKFYDDLNDMYFV